MADVTQILSRIQSGDPAATEELLPFVYEELRRLDAQKLVHEGVEKRDWSKIVALCCLKSAGLICVLFGLFVAFIAPQVCQRS